eukprot:CAMPEP_0182876060 /NCGR_PEP_ID=MMETSP0034_2-20130328/13927_1 /TAXON_ID=156128 /ORGANISM="Nephroselmis pyriformis, Strain CCMP717" /LENGTH=187 /DNA_ID=CAMNT_0025008829 /DNA_START=229 /DNA_END=792 /DNA_ORIENTATION=+
MAAAKRKAAGKALGKAQVLDVSRRANAREARALPIRMVTVHKGGLPGADDIAAEYTTKISRYCDFLEARVPPNPKNAKIIEEQTFSEGERVMKQLTARDHVIILDERGKDLTSEEFAALIADVGDLGAARLVFCIGGPFGHGDQVRERADGRVRLSKMVMNHQLARVMLYEQIYRAWTILKGEPYHH